MKRRTPLPDEINGWFDNLKPEDFIRETSAAEIVKHPEAIKSLGLHKGRTGFELFVQLMLEIVRVSLSEKGDLAAFAVLTNSDERRHFIGEDDELPAHFAGRLRREAQAMGATMSFTAMIAPCRAIYPGQAVQDIDPDDTQAVEDALMNGELDVGVCWTASLNDNGEREYRGGIMYLNQDGSPGQMVSGPMDANTDPFAGVLW